MADLTRGENLDFQIPEPTKERYRYCDCGDYGYVFFDYERNIATKIFRRDTNKSEDNIRRAMKEEVSAYQRIMNNTELLMITPKFYGVITFSNIQENSLRIPRAEVLIADCAYQMEFVHGRFDKYHLPSHITRLFYSAGVMSVDDVSVKVDIDDNVLCVIDFATHDYSDEL